MPYAGHRLPDPPQGGQRNVTIPYPAMPAPVEPSNPPSAPYPSNADTFQWDIPRQGAPRYGYADELDTDDYPLVGSAPGQRANWPLQTSETDDWAPPTEPHIPRQRDGRIAPPWQADDLAPPVEPDEIRMIQPPTLRLVGDGDRDRADITDSHDREGYDAAHIGRPPVDEEPDDDLLIFAEARSAWFVAPDEDPAEAHWSDAAADQGWLAAERAADPAVGDQTDVGLPRRVPKANLVPGAPLPPMSEGPLHIVRDPAAMAAHTTGYFRGSRRGEEVRGYAVGGRPGRESEGGWDFSRDGWDTDAEREYRSAARR
jgi:hypothetical protein